MIKNLLRIFFLCAIFCQVFTKVSAQYAVSGTAGTTLVNSVYWLTWDSGAKGSTLISTPTGYNSFNIINGTYVWQFSPTVRITAIISNEVTVASGGNNMQSYTPGEYSGDGLNYMYSGNNLPAPNSRGVANSGMLIVQGKVTFDMDIKVAILINGVYTNIVYPGMVIGDAESISSTNEYISGTTPSPIGWQLLNKRASGTAGDDHYLLQLSNSGTSFKLYVDQPPGNLGIQAVMFAHGASNLQNLSMQGEGNTALAVGFVLPFDLGDAPLSYGIAGNYIDQFVITDTFPGDGAYSVLSFPTTPLVPVSKVYIGANNVDPDGNPFGSVAANHDDTTGVNDEATIVPNLLPDIKVNQVGDVVLTVPATNGKSSPATLYGWLDFNNDGIFTSNEGVSVTVPANTGSTNYTLTFPNATFKNRIVAGPLYLRMRISTTTLVDNPATTVDDRSISFAADGETEDYKLKNILGVNISGTVVNDGNGGSDNVISGTPVQLVLGHQLYAYLINADTVLAQTPVATNGTYSFNANNGTYIVAISTNNVAIGNHLSAVSANLPAGYVPSGASYGTNNAFSTGVQAGAPNLQLQAYTPGTSLDITGLNFGINKAPVDTIYTATTNPGQSVSINVTTKATDADGTIDVTSVLLTDPASNTEKTSVTIAGQGTYTVNTTNGIVTFTPLSTFFSSPTPILYTIKDNFGTESVAKLIKIKVKPAGVADIATTPIATAVVINVKANDGASATGTTVTAGDGAHGVTSVDASGNVTYTPVANFIGTDTFTYILTASDGTASDPIVVTVNVKPAGVNDVASTLVNTPVTTNVKANDGPSGVGATVTPTFGAHGTTSVDGSGNVTYTPVANYTGTDTYTYTLTTPSGAVSAPITVTVTVIPNNPSMSLTKAANNTVSNVGDIINYTIVVKNTGNVALTNIVVSDAGADAGSISPTSVGALAIGASATFTAKHTVVQADVTAGRFSNTASVTSLDPGGNQVSTPASDDPTTPAVNDPTVSIIAQPGLIKLVKTGSFTKNIITYTFNIKNTGTVTLTNVTLTDTKLGLSNVVVAIPAGGLTAGSTAVYSAVYTLTQADKDLGTVTNNALVSSKDPSGNTITSPGSTTVSFPTSPVAVNDAATVNFNQPTVISVLSNDNSGNTTFNLASVEVDSAPAHGTAVANSDGTITYTPNNGYTGSDSFTYRVKDSYGYFTNVATVTINVTNYVASMSLTKTANNGVSKAGDIINYTIVVTNTGNVALTNIVVADVGANAGSVSPSSVATLAAGASATFTATYTITAADVTAGSYSNQASVTAKDPGGNPVSNPKSDDPTTPAPNDPTVVAITPTGSVSLVKSGTFSGNVITYTFSIQNIGTVSLNTITLTDSKLGLTNATVPVTGGTLAPGSTVTYTAAYTLTQADKDAGTVANTATVNSKDPGGHVVTSTSSFTVNFPKSPVANNDAATTNFNQPVIISVLNNDNPGNTTFNTQSIQIVTQPAHGTVVANSNGTVTYTPANNYIGSDSFTYRVQDSFGYYTNVASVVVTINTFTASMSLTKAANNGASNAGDVINYTLVVTNTGSAALTNIIVSDAGADPGSITPSNIPTLAAGASATVTAKHTVTQQNVNAGSYSNQASVIATDPIGNPVSNPKSDDPTTPAPNDPTVVLITPPGAIGLAKTGSFSGNTITYTFTIKNTGPVTLNTITLTDAKVGLFNKAITTPAGGLTSGSILTYTAIYTLTQADKNSGTVINNATVSSIDPSGHTVSNTANVSVVVPQGPTAANDAATTGVAQPVIIPILNNDNSVNTTFNLSSIQIVSPPSHGTTTINSDGTVTYTPAANFIGTDVFTYSVQDSYGYTTNIASVTITVASPGTISLSKTGVVNSTNNTITYTFTIKNTGQVPLTNVTITDTKLNITGATVTIPIGGLPAGASVAYTALYTLTQADRDAGTVVNNAFVSSKDPLGNTITGTGGVTITVPSSPIAINITTVTIVSQPVVIPVIKDGNPGTSTFDPGGIQIVTQPQHGTLTINSDGTITYTPNAGYTGADSFSYRLKDANGYYTNIATVTINDSATVVGLKIPNLFTPNFDGINDTFVIKGLDSYPRNELVIVNRWGNEVFRQTNYQGQWTGQGLNEGTYYYLLYIKNADGSIFTVLKGYTTLIRKLKK